MATMVHGSKLNQLGKSLSNNSRRGDRRREKIDEKNLLMSPDDFDHRESLDNLSNNYR